MEVIKVLHKDKFLAPKLRFKGFNDKWEKKTLFDICENVSYGMNAAATDYDGIHKYIRITDIDVNSGEFKPDPLTSPLGAIDGKFKLKKGDIVFARTGASVGKSHLYNPKDGALYFAGFLIKFSITKANPIFVYSLTLKEAYNKWVHIYSMRSGQPGLNAEEYKALKLNVPSLPEQQKIASFLSAVDEKIQQLIRKKELLEQYKKGVMQQLFSGKLRFKDENGKPFPKWEEKRLMEVVESERKIRYGVVQPGGFDENGRLLVRGQDYSQGWADVNSLFRVSDAVERKFSKARLKYQDLVITIVGAGTGYVAQVPIEFDDANITQTTARIAIDKTKGDPYYFLGYLRSSFGRKLIYSFIKGAAQPGLNVGDVEIFKVKVPCFAEQKKIANYLSDIDNKIEIVNKQITQTQTFKKGLLQQMFV